MKAQNLKTVELYTDGACSNNPGPGGWAAVLIYNDIKKEICGYYKDTTNNRMEIFSVIEGLRELKQSCNVLIYTDSQYVADAFNKGWIDLWQQNGWKNNDNKEVKNIDLFKALLIELKKHQYKFIKVKGHADNEFNNLCDKLATEQIKKAQEIQI